MAKHVIVLYLMRKIRKDLPSMLLENKKIKLKRHVEEMIINA